MAEPNLFRQAFNLWERTTSAYFEGLVRNPVFLTTNSVWLNSLLSTKKMLDSNAQTLLGAMGFATRRDQERTLHLLHQIEARIDDLEFHLDRPARA